MKTIVRSINRSHSRCGFFILTIALCWFALSPALKAGCPNPPGVCFGANTAVGEDALFNVTSGVWNVGVGVDALFNTADGNQNTGVGYQTLFSNTSGDHHTGIGSQALFHNTTGNDSAAVGFRTLYTNTTGSRNTGMGYESLAFNDIGNDNTATGWKALYNNRGTASGNNATGSQALYANNTGDQNNAFGHNALASNVGGQQNSAFGDDALQFSTGTRNTAVGNEAGTAVTTGSNNVYLGDNAGSNFNHSNESNTMRLGSDTGFSGLDPQRCFIAGIAPTAAVFQTVLTDPATHQIFRFTSSARYKKDIKPMDKASESIFALKPVTFHAKNDAKGIPQFGLIAEEVAKVNPDLVCRDADGRPDSVGYEQISVMLLNEFLKEHKKVEEQQASIADLKSTVALQRKEMQVLTAQLKQQAAQIQKVSAQLETSKPAPKVVANK